MTTRRRRFTAEFKKKVALEALRGADPVQAVAARYEIHPNQVSTWKRQAVEGIAAAFAGGTKGVSADGSRLKEAYAKIAELSLERDFLVAGLRPEPVVACGDGRRGGEDERGAAVLAAGSEPVVAVLRAEGRERGELGADASAPVA